MHLLRFGSAGPVDTVVSADAVVRDVDADGAALVRWELIRNCARAGDHPALQSGLALANAIRSLIDEPARRISSGTLTAVGSTASQPAERLPNSPLPSPPPNQCRTTTSP